MNKYIGGLSMVTNPNLPKISAIIHTRNEEQNIKNCLESIKWADEIIILDQESTDATVTIAKQYTNKIISCKYTGLQDLVQQAGLSKASHEWVLAIDADELIPLALKNKLTDIASSNAADAVFIPRCNYVYGYAGHAPINDMQLRFFKKNYTSYTGKIHTLAQIAPEARILKILDAKCSMIHLANPSVEISMEKTDRYTTIQARELFESQTKVSGLKFALRSLKVLMRELWLNKHYKDGWRGIIVSLMSAMYQLTIFLKLKLMHDNNNKDTQEAVQKKYNQIAAAIRDEYT